MTSRFKMQILDSITGDLVEWEPGLRIESEFITDCVSRILAKGVGMFRTSDHVGKDISNGIEEAILDLKRKVNPKHQVGE